MEYRDHPMGARDCVELRALAVQAVADGQKKSDVARRIGVTRQTLHNWVTKHRHGGAAALVAKPSGRVRREVLEPWQEKQVAGAILRLPPWTVDERYTRWTKKAIAGFVEQSFGVRLSAWLVDSHLRRWGFGSHKEARRAFMRQPPREAVQGGDASR